LQIQPGRGRSFAAAQPLQAVAAVIAVKLKSISIRIDKVDALGNQVVESSE
jgi:threonine dehydratase